MAYNKNTNWDNEKKYLDSLSKNGDAGQKAWAENQKKVLASAQAQYSSSSSGSSSGSSNGTIGSGGSSKGTSGSSKGTTNSQYSGNQYTIGSDRGKDKAQSMEVGTSWTNDVDGSVWTKNNDGSVSVSHNGVVTQNAYVPTTSSTSSQYVGTGTYNDRDLPDEAKQQIEFYKNMYNNAIAAGDIEQAEYAHNQAQEIRATYGYSGGDDGSEYIKIKQGITPDDILNFGGNYDKNNARPTQQARDPRIDALLNEILNRDDFSYNAQSDPLYAQYAKMYQREGDRAMKETMAEAAAGAGGMNSYAITAAQQTANNYAAQLGDKIPELYQLAYEMYLADKESKVQDLGILQKMDDTQYSRYRDTMNDWYKDKNFAYGLYQDAVQQGNLLSNFGYKSMIDNRDFLLKNTEYSDKKALQEREEAQERISNIIANNGTPPPDLIESAGLTQYEVDLRIAAEEAGEEEYTPSDGDGNGDDNVPAEIIDKINKCATNDELDTYLGELVASRVLTTEQRTKLYNQYKKPDSITALTAKLGVDVFPLPPEKRIEYKSAKAKGLQNSEVDKALAMGLTVTGAQIKRIAEDLSDNGYEEDAVAFVKNNGFNIE